MKQKNKVMWLMGIIISLSIVLISGISVLLLQKNKNNYQDIYETLKEQVNEEPKEPVTEELSDVDYIKSLGIKVPDKNLDWEALAEVNPDIYAWVCLPELDIDYPVLQHPTDNEYYLNHNMDGTEGYPGCIYTENYNKKDFTDSNTLIYGHNLKDATMFTALHRFEDPGEFSGDHYIFIYTKERVLCYEVFAAYEAPAIHQILNYDYSNPYVYEDYQKEIFNPQGRTSSYKEDYKLTRDDLIVTLSTCTKDSSDVYRYLCQGRLLNP